MSIILLICYNILMSELSTKFRRFRYKLKHEWFTADHIVLFVAAVVCLAWTCGSVSSMSRNWTLAQNLASEEREKALLELEVETLELENQYYLSDEYQELAARKYQNKKLPGETMIYLPENSEAAKTKHSASSNGVSASTSTMSNVEQWLKFLFGI